MLAAPPPWESRVTRHDADRKLKILHYIAATLRARGYPPSVREIALDVEVRDARVKVLPFASPQPGRTVGLAWRRTSPRKSDFIALGELVTKTLERDALPRPRVTAAAG